MATLGFIPIGSVLTFWFGFLLITLFTFKIGSFTFWQPFPKTSFQIQFTGDINTSIPAKVYILDGLTAPQTAIDALHAVNKKVVCQVSVGTVVGGSVEYSVLTEDMIGKAADKVANTYYVDIKNPSVLRIVEDRLDALVPKGCDAVLTKDAENWGKDTGFSVTQEDQLRFNLWMVRAAHELGLSIGLYDDQDQIPDLVDSYDFAFSDQCYAKDECAKFLPFIEEGKALFNVEYTGNKDTVCAYANEMEVSTVLKSTKLGSEYSACQ